MELRLSAENVPVTVAAESGLWFSDFVESRGTDGITLLPEALQLLRPRLQEDSKLLEDARNIIEIAHESAPQVLQWEERLVYLALAGRQIEMQEQVLRGIGSIRDGTRLPLADWIADMWPRLPPKAATHPLMAKLHEMAAGMTLRRAAGRRGGGEAATDWVIDFSSMATRELGVAFWRDRPIPSSANLPDAEDGIRVPDSGARRTGYLASTMATNGKQRIIERNQIIEVKPRTSATRVRTLAGQVYDIESLRPRLRSAFVSHSSADDRYVAEMESFLRAAGFDEVFNDVSAIRPDEKFWPEIEKGIANCDSFVVVITAASNSSEWVKREVEYARSLSKNIIPVWIEDCPIPPCSPTAT